MAKMHARVDERLIHGQVAAEYDLIGEVYNESAE